MIVFTAYRDILPSWFAGRGVEHYDTFMHFYLTGLLAFYYEGVAAASSRSAAFGRFPRVGLAIALLAAVDELVIQSRFPHRTPTMHDLAGNSLGALLFGWLALRARRIQKPGTVY